MQKLSIKQRGIITLIFVITIVFTLAWEYTHNGVAVHYILHNDQLPGFSNWWSLLIIPVFAFITSGFIRVDHQDNGYNKNVILRGIGLFIIGIAISYIFTVNPESNIPLYITGALFISSFFIPLFKAECLLGYVLGTLFIFGAFIPVIAGSILWILFYICYKTPRKIISLTKKKQ